MAQPTPYDRQFSFQDFQAQEPTTPLPGDEVDGELNSVKVTLDQTLVNLAKIQRDDGALKNGIVTQDALSDSLSIGFTYRGSWASAVNYLISDGASVGSTFYKAKSSHLSSEANQPPNAIFWDAIADFTPLAISVDSVFTAALQDNATTNDKLANMATATIKGRATAGTGDPEDLSPTQALTVIGALGVNQAGVRNLILNGGFRVNQRAFAGGALAAGVYGHDRWKADTGGASYSVSSGVATIASGTIVQVIEGISVRSGVHTINWTGTATCTVDGVARSKGATFTLTEFANCTVKFTGGTVSAVQIEPGNVVSTFETRPYGMELEMCRRFFMALPTPDVVPYGAASPAVMTGSQLLPVAMRTTPTVTVSVAPTLSNCSTFTASATTHQMKYSVTMTGSAGQYGVSGTGTLYLDAEL